MNFLAKSIQVIFFEPKTNFENNLYFKTARTKLEAYQIAKSETTRSKEDLDVCISDSAKRFSDLYMSCHTAKALPVETN